MYKDIFLCIIIYKKIGLVVKEDKRDLKLKNGTCYSLSGSMEGDYTIRGMFYSVIIISNTRRTDTYLYMC